MEGSQKNARFGTAITAVPDLNLDGFSDVVVGAPLEDNGQGAIYIYYGDRNTIRKQSSQVEPNFTESSAAHINISASVQIQNILTHTENYWNETGPSVEVLRPLSGRQRRYEWRLHPRCGGGGFWESGPTLVRI